MTVDRAVIEQTLREFCVTDDKETATTRISIWLSVERREGAVDALRKAAGRMWRRGMKDWLNALADKVETGGQL